MGALQLEAAEQEEAALKIQAIKRGATARAEIAGNISAVWRAIRADDAPALQASMEGNDVALRDGDGRTPLRAALDEGKYSCAAVLMGENASLALADTAGLTAWVRVQAAMAVGDDEEPPDVEDEGWQAEIAEELFPADTKQGGYIIRRVVAVGVYEGGRTARDKYSEPAFDSEVTAREGFGVSLAPQGEVYAGYHSDGARHGRGALRSVSGNVYAGEWKACKRHGTGAMLFSDGSVYFGTWAHGKRHGNGTYTYKGGERYTGGWSAGSKHGTGRYFDPKTGAAYEGEWRNGQLAAAKVIHADGSAFFGQFSNGQPCGKGAYVFSSGAIVRGNYLAAPKEEEDETEENATTKPSAWTSMTFGEVDHTTSATLEKQLCTVPRVINVCIAGPPAAGKGTAAEKIVAELALVHISTGDMLRAAMEDESNEDGQSAAEFMRAGELVPDELIVKLVLARLSEPDCVSNGWLLDGFPRTASQAAEMERNFLTPTKVVLLDVPDEVILERVTGRRLDPETGKVYHLTFNPPAGDDKEVVLARLTQRADDTEEALTKRLSAYAQNKQSIMAAFSSVSSLLVVDAKRDKDIIWSEVKAFLKDETL